MFTKNYRQNSSALLTIFAVFGLAILAFGAAKTANAQATKSTYLDFTGNGKTDWVTINALPNMPGQPFRWKVLGNPASPVPNEAFIRIFDYGSIGDILIPGDYIGDRKTDLTVLIWSSLNRQKTLYLSSIFNFQFCFKFHRAFVSQTRM